MMPLSAIIPHGENIVIDERQAEAANDFIRDNAGKHAEAKANRIQLMEFRKSKKAMLMNEKQGQPEHVRASHAYAHPDYLEILDGIQQAVEAEETLRWRMKAAEQKIELYRTQQANNRMVDKSHR